jgi:hypothetical protein
MTRPTPKPCPLCKRDSLLPHCQKGHCGWLHCSNRICDALLDFKLKVGHVIDRTPGRFGQRRKVTFLPGGEVA